MIMSSSPANFEGVLLIDKPSGITSHDVVDRVRRKLQMKRVGHAGTLDPNATGLIIILVGKATKVSQYLMDLDKEYEGTFKLGEATNTHDSDGEVTASMPVPEMTEDEVNAVMQSFVGDQYQTPPMFSAKKVGGQKLYKLARKGQEVEREARFIRVGQFRLDAFNMPEVAFTLRCSKGTYVRTIAHDLGQKIGCGAHLVALRRTEIDRFTIENSVLLEDFEEMELAEVRRVLMPTYQAVPSTVL